MAGKKCVFWDFQKTILLSNLTNKQFFGHSFIFLWLIFFCENILIFFSGIERCSRNQFSCCSRFWSKLGSYKLESWNTNEKTKKVWKDYKIMLTMQKESIPNVTWFQISMKIFCLTFISIHSSFIVVVFHRIWIMAMWVSEGITILTTVMST